MPARPDPPLRRRRRQRWLLTALGLVFAVSAVLRLGALEAAFADIGADAPPGSATVAPDLARSLQDALAEVAALRLTLDLRDAALADRARAVAAAEALVESRLAELEAAEARLAALIATSDAAAETDLDRLTRVYETMAPEEAAAVFAQMQPSFAAGFLARMSPAASATLMAALPPEQAYAVSVIIATRNSSAPRLAPPDPPPTAPGDTEN
jgi:flagellar motility protein MotE (MotC chaperone)